MKKLYILSVYLLLHGFAYSQADLLVNTLVIDTNGNDPVYVGNTITGTITVKNAGNIASNKCFISIYISPTSDYTQGDFLGKISLQSVDAGATTSDIIFKYPIPYTIANDGNYNIVVYINQSQIAPEQDYNNNSLALQIPSLIKGKQFARAAQNLPYPIIFIHGLNSCDTTWNILIDSLQKHFGWSYGGNMNFCLNLDGNSATSDTTKDYKDFTSESSLRNDDFYTVNFDVSRTGVPIYTLNGLTKIGENVKSNQSAIVKQGIAIKDAIKHVLNVTKKDKVILVGHSMGGLAAREYLQNQNIFVESGNHHVAKLVTIGTPHGGSNADLGPLDIVGTLITGLDVNSEAVRDLRTSYSYPPFNRGVYLFGGNETLTSMIDNFDNTFWNADINCDGIVNGGRIIGLNEKEKKPIPLDLPYTCLIGLSNKYIGGDGVVKENSANLNNYFPNVNADTFKVIEPISWNINILNPLDVWHTGLTSQFQNIMQGIDEPNIFSYAYEVDFGKLYYGNFTIQSNNRNTTIDDDYYKIFIQTAGKLNLSVFNIPVNTFAINVFDNKGNTIFNSGNDFKSCLNVNIPISYAGDYYIKFSAIPGRDTWKSPYAFQLTLNTTTATRSSCYYNFTTTTGGFNDGSSLSNYANNTNCSWLINPSGVSSITLRFNSFNTEWNNDTVNVYDGSDSTYPLLGKFSGSSIPAVITSTGSTMFVTFKSNSSVTYPGWDATYTSTVVQNRTRNPTYTMGYKYWFDGDISNGNMIMQDLSNSDSIFTDLQLPTTLRAGFHTVSFIMQQSDKLWSVPVTNNFYYAPRSGATFYEYWFDTAYNNKQIVQIADTSDMVLTNQMLSADLLRNGFHQFNIRSRPNGGLWSSVQSVDFFKRGNDLSPAEDIKQFRYWFDTSFSKTQIIVTTGQNGELDKLLDCTNLTIGQHKINYQTMDNSNIWSSVFVDSFTVACIPPAAPIINSKNPITFCQGLNDTLISSIGSGNQWYLNSVPISGANKNSYVATASGIYSVLSSSGSCISDTSNKITITVNSIPVRPVITSVNDTVFCEGLADTLVSSAANGNQWYLNGDLIAGAVSENYIANTSGNYTVVSTVNNCSSSQSSVTSITVNPLPSTPVITSKGIGAICTGSADTLVSNAGAGNQWYLNDTAINGANGNVFIANTGGNYTVTTNNGSCNSQPSIPIKIIVYPKPIKPVITNSRSLIFCFGDSTILTSSVNSANQWFLNDTAIVGETGINYTAKTSGNYLVVTTNDNGCSATSTAITVTSNPIPLKPVITSQNPTIFCDGSLDTLMSSAANGNQWYLNGVAIPGAIEVSYAAKLGGSYTDTTINQNGCKAGSGIMLITAIRISTPVISQKSDTLISSATTGNQWYLNGVLIPGAVSQKYKALSSGIYTVIVTGAFGCSSSASTGLSVVITAVNTINLNSKEWKLFPNPLVNGILYIQKTGIISISGKVKAQISTQDGRLMAEKSIGSSSQWDLRALANGVYYLRIIENKIVSVYQIIK